MFSGDVCWLLRAAQSCWFQAVDCALQSSGVVQKWDGVSFGGGSMPKTVKHAGVWGCLQAAVIAAKIAQWVSPNPNIVRHILYLWNCWLLFWPPRFILTSDINQRTKCCLLSSHLFKVIPFTRCYRVCIHSDVCVSLSVCWAAPWLSHSLISSTPPTPSERSCSPESTFSPNLAGSTSALSSPASTLFVAGSSWLATILR